MKIVQISDLHVAHPAERVRGDIDAASWLVTAVDRINARIAPDLVVVTGDVAHRGLPVEYERANAILAQLNAPYVVVPGNHDDRNALVDAFGYRARLETPRCNYVVEEFPVRLIALDSSVHHWPGGDLDAQTLRWFETALSRSGRPTLVLMHHPPVRTGIFLADLVGTRGARGLGRIVAGNRNIVGILCGHIHRAKRWEWMGTTITTAPSTAPHVLPELAFAGVVYRPYAAGFAVHEWRDGRLHTEQLLQEAPPSRVAVDAADMLGS